MSCSKKNKIYNFTLKAITVVAVIAFILGVCSMDSLEILIPTILVSGSMMWMFLFGFANDWFKEKGD